MAIPRFLRCADGLLLVFSGVPEYLQVILLALFVERRVDAVDHLLVRSALERDHLAEIVESYSFWNIVSEYWSVEKRRWKDAPRSR